LHNQHNREMYTSSAPMYALVLCGAAELASAFSIAPIPLRTPARASASCISMMAGKGDLTGDVSRRSALALGLFGGISALSPGKVPTPIQHAAPVWPDAPLLAWSPASSGCALQHHHPVAALLHLALPDHRDQCHQASAEEKQLTPEEMAEYKKLLKQAFRIQDVIDA
jgi:hypothetical protein